MVDFIRVSSWITLPLLITICEYTVQEINSNPLPYANIPCAQSNLLLYKVRMYHACNQVYYAVMCECTVRTVDFAHTQSELFLYNMRMYRARKKASHIVLYMQSSLLLYNMRMYCTHDRASHIVRCTCNMYRSISLQCANVPYARYGFAHRTMHTIKFITL